MKRVAKHAGHGHIVVEDVPVPDVRDTDVLIRAHASLISRGSELWRRYVSQEAVPHAIMGYSLAGVVERVGSGVTGFEPGQRVASVSPHAEYVCTDLATAKVDPPMVALPDRVSFEAGTFWPLLTSCRLWVWELDVQPGDRVAIVGQGLVGSLCMQIAVSDAVATVAAVDVLPLRCELAGRFGADRVINAADEDPVQAVRDWTGGQGASAVVYAVGGPAGPKVFEQAQQMVAPGGLIQVLGLYEGASLPLDSGAIQGKRLVGGYTNPARRPEASDAALGLLADGRIATDAMITHRFPPNRAPEAFDLLYHHPEHAMAVLIDWAHP